MTKILEEIQKGDGNQFTVKEILIEHIRNDMQWKETFGIKVSKNSNDIKWIKTIGAFIIGGLVTAIIKIFTK